MSVLLQVVFGAGISKIVNFVFHAHLPLAGEVTFVRWRVAVGNSIVYVFESRPYWTPELQRQFQKEDLRVRACSSIVDVRRHLDSHAETNPNTKQIVVLDLDAGSAECLQFLGRRNRSWNSDVIVVGSPTTLELEWSIRELGAFGFVPHDIGGDELARICRRQFATAVELN